MSSTTVVWLVVGLWSDTVPQVYREMEPHPALLMKLLPYQKEFLAWAIDQVRPVSLVAVAARYRSQFH